MINLCVYIFYILPVKQEEAVKEEKQAMEKIATILASLTAKKTAMVSCPFLVITHFSKLVCLYRLLA